MREALDQFGRLVASHATPGSGDHLGVSSSKDPDDVAMLPRLQFTTVTYDHRTRGDVTLNSEIVRDVQQQGSRLLLVLHSTHSMRPLYYGLQTNAASSFRTPTTPATWSHRSTTAATCCGPRWCTATPSPTGAPTSSSTGRSPPRPPLASGSRVRQEAPSIPVPAPRQARNWQDPSTSPGPIRSAATSATRSRTTASHPREKLKSCTCTSLLPGLAGRTG